MNKRTATYRSRRSESHNTSSFLHLLSAVIVEQALPFGFMVHVHPTRTPAAGSKFSNLLGDLKKKRRHRTRLAKKKRFFSFTAYVYGEMTRLTELLAARTGGTGPRC